MASPLFEDIKMTSIINIDNPSASLAVTTSAARVALPANNVTNVRVYYTGTDICYLETGNSTVTAATASPKTFITSASGVEVFSISPNDTHISAVSTGSGGTLYIQSTTGQ